MTTRWRETQVRRAYRMTIMHFRQAHYCRDISAECWKRKKQIGDIIGRRQSRCWISRHNCGVIICKEVLCNEKTDSLMIQKNAWLWGIQETHFIRRSKSTMACHPCRCDVISRDAHCWVRTDFTLLKQAGLIHESSLEYVSGSLLPSSISSAEIFYSTLEGKTCWSVVFQHSFAAHYGILCETAIILPTLNDAYLRVRLSEEETACR
jgi:hypothetical protein